MSGFFQKLFARGTPADEKRGVDDAIFSQRAIFIGLCVCGLLVLLGLAWRIATNADAARRAEIKEFQFALSDPPAKPFTLKDPGRGIVQERPEGAPEAVVVEAKPDIHIRTSPIETPSSIEVIQSPNTALNTQEMDFKIDPKSIDLSAKVQTGVPDAPEEIQVESEVTSWPIQVIGAQTQGPAEMFKFDHPIPRDKPQVFTYASAPKPGRTLKGVLQAFGDQNAPSMGQLGPVNINLFGTGGDVFRWAPRQGGIRARNSVDSALHWLAVHQEPDGMYDAEKHEGKKNGSLASTGLAVLAFMGGGNTTRKGEYSRNVLRGLEAIMRHQKEDGLITAGGDNHYTHAICTIALCEAYGRASDERVGAAARKAIAYCERVVNNDGGWRYRPKEAMSDMSVTAWFIQALKTAKLARLKYSETIYRQAEAFVDSVTDAGGSKDSNGVVTYTPGADAKYDSNGHPALTAAGMMVRQFSGMGVRHHLLVKGAELTKARAPSWTKGQKDFYYWYYATYAMHNMGGEYRIWWNQKIRDVLLENQSRDGDNAGSWDPTDDRWAGPGGRVYTTALGALCLEVYYRYTEALTSFGTAPDLEELFFE